MLYMFCCVIDASFECWVYLEPLALYKASSPICMNIVALVCGYNKQETVVRAGTNLDKWKHVTWVRVGNAGFVIFG